MQGAYGGEQGHMMTSLSLWGTGRIIMSRPLGVDWLPGNQSAGTLPLWRSGRSRNINNMELFPVGVDRFL